MMTKKRRQEIKMKYGGLCAYTGTVLEDDWQVDHIHPLCMVAHKEDGTSVACIKGKLIDPFDVNCDSNVVPCQRIINHYKRGQSLEMFRKYIATLHIRIKTLPKNPRVERSIRRKEYVLKVAELFGITEDRPFNGLFYFELESVKG